jgi:hypothetical protein
VNLPLVACHVGSAAFLLYGVGHTLGYLQGRRIEASLPHVAALKQTPAELPGVTRTYFDLYEGYSWMTAVMTFAFGLLNEVLALSAPDLVASNRALAAVNVAVALVATVLARRHFFAAPLVLSALAALAFAVPLVAPA